VIYDLPPELPGYWRRDDTVTQTIMGNTLVISVLSAVSDTLGPSEPPKFYPRHEPVPVPNPGMTRSAWHREHRAPSPPVLGVARSQEVRPFVPRAPVERRHRSSLRRFVAGV
jgi:hypothetical protein